jgi:recombination protein RecT
MNYRLRDYPERFKHKGNEMSKRSSETQPKWRTKTGPSNSEMAATSRKAALERSPVGQLTAYVDKNKSRIFAAVPDGVRGETIVRTFLGAVRRDPKLAACTPESLHRCLEEMTLTGLQVGTGLLGKAFLIPYGKVAQFQIGYRGVMELCERGGKGDLVMDEVREGDTFQNMGVRTLPIHTPADDPLRHEKKLTYAWAAFVPHQGIPKVAVWSVEKCIAHRDQYSKGYHGKKDDAWHPTNPAFAQMCMKTALMSLAKFLPLTADVMSVVDTLTEQADYADIVPAVQDSLPAPEQMAAGEIPMNISREMVDAAAKECETTKQVDDVWDDLETKYPEQAEYIGSVFAAYRLHLEGQGTK